MTSPRTHNPSHSPLTWVRIPARLHLKTRWKMIHKDIQMVKVTPKILKKTMWCHFWTTLNLCFLFESRNCWRSRGDFGTQCSRCLLEPTGESSQGMRLCHLTKMTVTPFFGFLTPFYVWDVVTESFNPSPFIEWCHFSPPHFHLILQILLTIST